VLSFACCTGVTRRETGVRRSALRTGLLAGIPPIAPRENRFAVVQPDGLSRSGPPTTSSRCLPSPVAAWSKPDGVWAVSADDGRELIPSRNGGMYVFTTDGPRDPGDEFAVSLGFAGPLGLLATLADRELTAEEWNEYVPGDVLPTAARGV
jgi:hypothetical protein